MAIFGSIRRGNDQSRRRGSSGRRSSQLHYSGVSNAYSSATGSGSRPSRNRKSIGNSKSNSDPDDPESRLYGPGVPLFDPSVRTSSRWIPRHGASGEDAGWGPGRPLAVPPAQEGGHRPLPQAQLQTRPRLLPKNPSEGRSTGPPRPIIVFRKKAGDCGASGLSSLSTGTPCGGAWPDPGLGCIETANGSFGGFYDPSAARGGGIERAIEWGPSGDTGSSSTGTSTRTPPNDTSTERTPPNDATVTTAWSSAETILARGAGAGGVVVDVIVNGPKDTSTSSSRVRHMDRIVRILKRLDHKDGVASASKSASASARTIASLASREASTHHHVFEDDNDHESAGDGGSGNVLDADDLRRLVSSAASAGAAIPPSQVGSSPRKAPSRAGPVSAAKTGSGPGSGSPTSVADPFFDRATATGTPGASLSAEAEAPASGSGCHSCLGSPADLSRHFSESLAEIRREVGALCFHPSAAVEPDDSLLLSREDGSQGSGNGSGNDNGESSGGDWIEIEAPPGDPPRAPYPYPPVASAAADARVAVPTTSTDEHYFRRTATQASI